MPGVAPAKSLWRISLTVSDIASPQEPDIARIASRAKKTVEAIPGSPRQRRHGINRSAAISRTANSRRAMRSTTQKATTKNVQPGRRNRGRVADVIGDGPLGVTIPAVVTHGKSRIGRNIDRSGSTPRLRDLEDKLGAH